MLDRRGLTRKAGGTRFNRGQGAKVGVRAAGAGRPRGHLRDVRKGRGDGRTGSPGTCVYLLRDLRYEPSLKFCPQPRVLRLRDKARAALAAASSLSADPHLPPLAPDEDDELAIFAGQTKVVVIPRATPSPPGPGPGGAPTAPVELGTGVPRPMPSTLAPPDMLVTPAQQQQLAPTPIPSPSVGPGGEQAYLSSAYAAPPAEHDYHHMQTMYVPPGADAWAAYAPWPRGPQSMEAPAQQGYVTQGASYGAEQPVYHQPADAAMRYDAAGVNQTYAQPYVLEDRGVDAAAYGLSHRDGPAQPR
jgi:hypothetical protein